MNIGTPFIALVNCVLNLFVYCHIAYKSTEQSLNVGDFIYETNWNQLPIKYQKYFILMIQNAQQPMHYHGFKMIKIHLGTFTAVSTNISIMVKKD